MLIKTYIFTLIPFLIIDFLWLAVIAKNLYQKYLGYLMKSPPNWSAAIIFYLLFTAGIVYFVVNPSLEKNSIQKALISGSLFGLISYATYDLTNLATIKNWPFQITLIDLFWGTILCASTSTISYYLCKNFG